MHGVQDLCDVHEYQSHAHKFIPNHIIWLCSTWLLRGFLKFKPLIFFPHKAVLEPRVSPAFAITYFCNHCNIRFENTSKYVDTLTLFSKNLNQRSLTPRWPLTPCLLRSHVWLYPRIIVSKSHDNTSMYVDTVINFAKYHIHTHTYHILHTTYRLSDHIVSYWTQFRRDNKTSHRWPKVISSKGMSPMRKTCINNSNAVYYGTQKQLQKVSSV